MVQSHMSFKGVKMTELEIGKGQMKVLRILWERKQATAQEIIDVMNEHEPVKRSTVQTFLRTLERKGVITHDVNDRTFVYYPVEQRDVVTKHAFRSFMDHMFEGSIEGLVSYIIHNERVSTDELKNIIELMEKKET